MKIQAADLKQPVLFVVDMINGFAKQGALADPAISDAAPNIRKLIQSLNAPTWFVADEHDWNAREFDAFPPHCLKNTEESSSTNWRTALSTGSRKTAPTRFSLRISRCFSRNRAVSTMTG